MRTLTTSDGTTVKSVLLVADVPGEDVTTYFVIEHTLDTGAEVLAAIRKAVVAWEKTPDGQEAWLQSCRDFNWGDLASNLEAVVKLAPGIVSMARGDDAMEVVRVLHDEVLMEGPRRWEIEPEAVPGASEPKEG
jgi:hypothetical protein